MESFRDNDKDTAGEGARNITDIRGFLNATCLSILGSPVRPF